MWFLETLQNYHFLVLLLGLACALLSALALLLYAIHLSARMPGESSTTLPTGPMGGNEKTIARCLRRHVRTLSEEIGPRSVYRYENLSKAASYIQQQFDSYGYDLRLQEYAPGEYARQVVNIEAERRGTLKPDEIIVFGAHYDSIGENCPGADDNASGVAALLCIAERCASIAPSRTIRFVAFANEEPPFFRSKDMGSYRYARVAKQHKEKIVAFICLESIGFYSEYSKTQRYPFPLSWWFPDTGNFLGFVGNWKSADLLRRSIRVFRTVSPIPSLGFAAPSWFPSVASSDHWSFWKHDYPAFMLTDTAPYRNQYYHTENDRWDTLDYATFSRCIPGIEAILRDLLRLKD